MDSIRIDTEDKADAVKAAAVTRLHVDEIAGVTFFENV